MTTNATDRRSIAAASGIATFVWYAMPDLVRSRGVRVVLKTVVIAALAPQAARVLRMGDVMPALPNPADVPPARLAAGGAAALAAAALAAAGEKWIYARGERRRARGVPLAHSRAALRWAVLAAAAAVFGNDDLTSADVAAERGRGRSDR